MHSSSKPGQSCATIGPIITRRSRPDHRRLEHASPPTVLPVRHCAVLPTTTLWCPSTFRTKPTSGAEFEKPWNRIGSKRRPVRQTRSEEHTSELQSLRHLVC